jgi:hypothetical protein
MRDPAILFACSLEHLSKRSYVTAASPQQSTVAFGPIDEPHLRFARTHGKTEWFTARPHSPEAGETRGGE